MNRNDRSWNPWHGCRRLSEGCKNCYMFFLDKQRDRDGSEIHKNKTDANLPLKKDRQGNYKIKNGEFVRVCMSSDFFLEEADEWRDEAWDMIRQRPDVMFSLLTKRAYRIKECLPNDWGNGWEHFHLSISIENQEMADKRLPYFLDAPLKHREVFCSPLIAHISLSKYLDTGLIKCVNVGGEMSPKSEVRPIMWEWVRDLFLEAKERNIEFYFHQCGSMFMRDGVNIGKWKLNEQIARAEEIQHELEEMYN